MEYRNVNLLHIANGVCVQAELERSDQFVFAYDSSCCLIQNFVFGQKILSGIPDISNISKVIIEEDSFLFYSHAHQKSFAHYMVQCVPKIQDYLKDPARKFVVPSSMYNSLCKELVEMFEIDQSKILLLEDNKIYSFKSLLHIKSHEWQDIVTERLLFIFKKIRESVEFETTTRNKKIYIKRDGIKNLETGNDETGILRKIVNEKELIEALEQRGFEIVEIGTKSLKEKCELLRKTKVIITQVGANCINLGFSSAPDHLLLLSNETPIWHKFYVDLCTKVNEMHTIDTKIFCYSSINNRADLTNPANGPFNVDLSQILHYINEIEAK
jgi:hypothetical protein